MVEQQEFGLIQKFKAIFINIVQLQTAFGLDGKAGGTLAVANTWIAPRTHATAYWNCR